MHTRGFYPAEHNTYRTLITPCLHVARHAWIPHCLHHARLNAAQHSTKHVTRALNSCRQDNAHAVKHRRKCRVFDLHDQVVPYEKAWSWQHALVSQALEALGPASGAHDASGSGAPSSSGGADGGGGGCDSLILLQHAPVYTLGAGSSMEHVLFDPAAAPAPLHRTERGGEVTYHGPGQLVLYPILDLSQHRQDLHWYLRQLEEVVIRALAAVSELRGERVPGQTGVWVGDAKVAAIGVRARRWVTFHGLALNVTADLSPFGAIVPCGLTGRAVTSVQRLVSQRRQQQVQQQQGDEARPGPAERQRGEPSEHRHGSQQQRQQQQWEGNQQRRELQQEPSQQHLGDQQQQQKGHERGAIQQVGDHGHHPHREAGEMQREAGVALGCGSLGQGHMQASDEEPGVLLRKYRDALIGSFGDVFGVDLAVASGVMGELEALGC